jgi:hypothetical protein
MQQRDQAERGADEVQAPAGAVGVLGKIERVEVGEGPELARGAPAGLFHLFHLCEVYHPKPGSFGTGRHAGTIELTA